MTQLNIKVEIHTQLNFCKKCGAKRVRDVKEELENLLQQDPRSVSVLDSCALCSQPLKKTRKYTKKRTKNDTIEVQILKEPKKSRKLVESDSQTENEEEKNEEKYLPEKVAIKSEPIDEVASENSGSHQEDQNIPNVSIKKDQTIPNVSINAENNQSGNSEGSESEAESVDMCVDENNVTADEVDQFVDRVRKKPDGFKREDQFVDRVRKKPDGLKRDFESVVADMIPSVRECISKSDDLKQQFQCTHCDKKFAFMGAFAKHVRKFHPTVGLTDNKVFKCKLCDSRFIRRYNLKTHGLMHSDYRPFKCNYPPCTAAFKDKHTLAGHEFTHTGGVKRHRCQYCSKTFRKTNQMKSHMLIHTGVKPYMCEFCGLRFTQKQNLTTHERRHTEDKPYVCKTCGRAFYQPTHLKTHMMDHTGERPFVCEVCGYSCKSKGFLKAHMSVHRPDKPHKCDKCDFVTKRKENLVKHMVTHNTERPFQCKYCMQVFKLKDSLTKHQSRHMDSEGKIQEHAKRKPPSFRPAKYNVKSRREKFQEHNAKSRQKYHDVNSQSNAVMYGSTLMDLSTTGRSQEHHSFTSDGCVVVSIPHPSYNIQGSSSSGLIIPHHTIAQTTMVQASSSDISHEYEPIDVSLKSL